MEESAGPNLSICTKVLCVERPDALAFLFHFCPPSLWLCHHQSVLLLCGDAQKERQRQGIELAPPHCSAWLEVNSLLGPGGKGQPSKAEKVGDDI